MDSENNQDNEYIFAVELKYLGFLKPPEKVVVEMIYSTFKKIIHPKLQVPHLDVIIASARKNTQLDKIHFLGNFQK